MNAEVNIQPCNNISDSMAIMTTELTEFDAKNQCKYLLLFAMYILLH